MSMIQWELIYKSRQGAACHIRGLPTMAQLPGGLCTCCTRALQSQEPQILCNHKQLMCRQSLLVRVLSGFNYLIRYHAGQLGTKQMRDPS